MKKIWGNKDFTVYIEHYEGPNKFFFITRKLSLGEVILAFFSGVTFGLSEEEMFEMDTELCKVYPWCE